LLSVLTRFGRMGFGYTLTFSVSLRKTPLKRIKI
jgi:hypothetical protein